MLERTSVDGVEPITNGEVKNHCYITATDSATNTIITNLITAARNYGENRTWRTLVDSTYKQYLDDFPRDIIELPRSPVISVTSIEYIDSDGNTQTVDSSNYIVDTVSEPARIERKDNFTWPIPDDRVNAVIITYTAGYGDDTGPDPDESTVPEDIKIALLMHIKYLYDNRDSHVLIERSGAEFTSSPRGTDFILDQYSLRHP